MQPRGSQRFEVVASGANALRRKRQQRRDIAPDAERERCETLGIDIGAELRQHGRPRSKDGGGISGSAAQTRTVRHALGKPDTNRERPAGQFPEGTCRSHRQVAVTRRHPAGGRAIHLQHLAVGAGRLHAEAHQIVPVDRDEDAVDVVPAVSAAGDDLEREVELCVCGDDPRGKARHCR